LPGNAGETRVRRILPCERGAGRRLQRRILRLAAALPARTLPYARPRRRTGVLLQLWPVAGRGRCPACQLRHRFEGRVRPGGRNRRPRVPRRHGPRLVCAGNEGPAAARVGAAVGQASSLAYSPGRLEACPTASWLTASVLYPILSTRGKKTLQFR